MKNKSHTLSENIQKGVLAPLFDCLAQDTQEDIILNLKGLKASIAKELEMILNTKPTALLHEYLPMSQKKLHSLPQFFGLRDFNLQQASHEGGRRQIVQEITYIIEKYEPRLKNVQVTLTLSSVHKFSATVDISGDIIFGNVMERITFPVYINNLIQDKI